LLYGNGAEKERGELGVLDDILGLPEQLNTFKLKQINGVDTIGPITEEK
jgi:hypothetical protein